MANPFNSYQNPILNFGPGSSIDLTPFVPLSSNPATLVDAVDLTLTHGKMPAPMKHIILASVTADTSTSLHRVLTAIYLTMQFSYYNVWH